MANFASVLRQEIARLARKEIRVQIDPARKALAQQRKHIAELKREIATLTRQVKTATRAGRGATAPTRDESPEKRIRFVAKGLRSQRSKLGLSAADFGKLIGVSGQSIYNWEREEARPRGSQIAKLVGIRGLSKREAAQRLEAMPAPRKKKGA